MKNITGLLKQAQQMQQKMEEMQSQMGDVLCEGSSGAGLVKVTMNGKREVVKIEIDSSLLVQAEKEVLEDLLIAAMKDVSQKTEENISQHMGKITEGMPLPPGFKLPF